MPVYAFGKPARKNLEMEGLRNLTGTLEGQRLNPLPELRRKGKRWSAMPGAGYFCVWFSLGQTWRIRLAHSGQLPVPAPPRGTGLPYAPRFLSSRRRENQMSHRQGFLHKCQVAEGGQLPGHGR